MTVVIVTEKPSAARHMATALGGMTGTYDGEAYEVVSLRGHLYEFAKPNAQVDPTLEPRYRSWGISNLPWKLEDIAWKRVANPGTSDMLRTLKSALGRASEVVCATDIDPTGEGGLLFGEPIVELGITPRKLTRMYFTDETPKSLQAAFSARKVISGGIAGFDEYKMADARSKFDWLTMQFTRVATEVVGGKPMLRQGRLKSAMVLLVGDQLKAYNDYVRKPFFQNRFRDDHDVLYTSPDEPIFATEAEVPRSYKSSSVVLDKKEQRTQAPPRLLDLAALSARLSGKGVKADQVLATYQKMYEAQVVSYPRTDDKTITKEQFKEMLPLVDKIAGVVGVDPATLTRRTARTTHVKDTGAHGANRPGPQVPPSLADVAGTYGPVGRLIYEELARSFLAMFAEDYGYETQYAHVKDYPAFVGKVSVPKVRGWKDVFSAGDIDADENTTGVGSQAQPVVFEGENKRPEHPTMTWLMKQLERRDVGTGATRTSTYADVTKPQSAKNPHPLLVDLRGKITMAEAGEISYRLLPGTRIGDLGVTEYIYQKMREIAAGTTTTEKELAIVAQWVREDIETMRKNAVSVRKELGMSEKTATQGQSKEKFEGPWAEQGGEHVRFSREWSGVRFTDEQCEQLLAGKEISFPATSKAGKPYTATGKLAQQSFQAEGRTVNYIGFKLDTSKPPRVFLGHTFTDEEYNNLVAGHLVYVDDLYSQKSQKNFAATVSFVDETGSGEKKIKLTF